MKAYVLEGVNNLVYKDVDIQKCESGWAIVKVRAAGICSSDVPRIFKKGTYHFPTIPGHEFAGVVDAVGNEGDSWLIGKKVGVFPLIPCRKCEQCKDKHYEMCSNYDYVGSRRDGGFAEFVAVPVWNLLPLNADISFESAAMLEPLAVALHAMKLANIKNGDSVGIVGTGMIGFSAAQWAKKLGARNVTVIGRNLSKKVLADNVDVSYETIDNHKTEYDVVLEAVGTNDAIDFAISVVKPAGKLVLMGNPEGDINLSQNTYWRILRKQLHIVGTWNSVYENGAKCDWSEVVETLNNKEIKAEQLISHRFDSKHLGEGLQLMLNHKEPYCKVMTVWEE